jgi:TP901 family phage tail tape measure protein
MALGQKEVRLSIKANTKKFEDELKKLPGITGKEAKKMARKFAREFDKVEKNSKKTSKEMQGLFAASFAKMGIDAKKFKSVLAAAGFAVAAKKLFNLANSASEYVDKVMLMSRQTGLASETLIGMEFAAEAAGTNIDQLQSGLNAFVMKAGQAANIGGASAAVFERLGVSVKDAGGELRSTDEIFRDTINAIAGLDSASEKATTAAELFGARGAKLAAVFADGTGAIDEYAAKAAEAGIVMDRDALKASANMDRSMADLKMTMRGVVQEAGQALIPAMIVIAQAIGKVIQQIAHAVNWWDSFTDSIFANLEAGQDAQNSYVGTEKALIQVMKAARDFDGQLTTTSGNMIDGARAANTLQLRLNHAEEASVRLGQGYKLSASEQATLNRAMAEGRKIAEQLGLDFDALAAGAKAVREEEIDLSQVDMSDLESELGRLGQSTTITDKLGESADQAADRLAALNRSFELEALARVDEPLAKFQKEIDRVNEALLQGLDAQLGHDAILAAIDELNETRLEKEAKIQKELADLEQKRIDERIAAEEAAAAAQAQIQSEFYGGVETLANDIFNLAKNQRNISAEQAKGFAIAQAIMNTSVAVTKTLAELGPAGIPLAGVIAAQGAVQLAMIQQQSSSFHQGGIVAGMGDQPITAQGGEVVLNRSAVAALGGAEAADSLNSGAPVGGSVVVQMTYKQRLFDQVVIDNLAKGGPLRGALNKARREGRRGRVGGRL